MTLPTAAHYQPTPKERKALSTRGLLRTSKTPDGSAFYKIDPRTLKDRMVTLLIEQATVRSRADFDQKAISLPRFASEIVGIADDGTWTDEGIDWVWKALKDRLSTNPNASSVQSAVRATGTWLVKDNVTRSVEGEGLAPMLCWALTKNVTLLNALDIVPRRDAMVARVASHHRVDGQLVERVPEAKAYVLAAQMLRLETERAMYEAQRAELTAGMEDGERRQLLSEASGLYEKMSDEGSGEPHHGAA